MSGTWARIQWPEGEVHTSVSSVQDEDHINASVKGSG